MLTASALNCARKSDVYDESTSNNVFIEGADPSIRLSLRNYWATHPQAYLADIAFQAKSVLVVQKGSGNPPLTNQEQTRSEETLTLTTVDLKVRSRFAQFQKMLYCFKARVLSNTRV